MSIMVTYPNGQTVDIQDPDFNPKDLDETMFDPSPVDPMGVLVPYLKTDPRWIIMGGLGDVDEVGPARKRWPSCRFIGVDPDQRALDWQKAHNWPKGDRLIRSALSDKGGIAEIRMDSICCPSMHPENIEAAPPEELQATGTMTLDRLADNFGPFYSSVLWLDCEGWDYNALLGGKRLLKSGKVQCVNFEIWYRLPETSQKMYDLLESFGYVRAEVWFRQHWGHNEVWRLK